MLTQLDDGMRCNLSFFLKHMQDYDGVFVDAIDNAPCLVSVLNPQLVAAWPDS